MLRCALSTKWTTSGVGVSITGIDKSATYAGGTLRGELCSLFVAAVGSELRRNRVFIGPDGSSTDWAFFGNPFRVTFVSVPRADVPPTTPRAAVSSRLVVLERLNGSEPTLASSRGDETEWCSAAAPFYPLLNISRWQALRRQCV